MENVNTAMDVNSDEMTYGKCLVWGKEATILSGRGYVAIIWSTDEGIFTLGGTLGEEEMIRLANGIKAD